jgi:hypothetical protein
MRAEYAAALTNFLLILVIAIAMMAMSSGSNGSVHVYASPIKAAVSTALIVLMIAMPLGTLAFWRTWVHAQRVMACQTTGWRGVFEAGALGFVLTLPFVMPGIIARQFNPGEWGQPRAFLLGLGYVGVYGLLGLVVGLVLGFVLWLSARLVLLLYRRPVA